MNINRALVRDRVKVILRWLRVLWSVFIFLMMSVTGIAVGLLGFRLYQDLAENVLSMIYDVQEKYGINQDWVPELISFAGGGTVLIILFALVLKFWAPLRESLTRLCDYVREAQNFPGPFDMLPLGYACGSIALMLTLGIFVSERLLQGRDLEIVPELTQASGFAASISTTQSVMRAQLRQAKGLVNHLQLNELPANMRQKLRELEANLHDIVLNANRYDGPEDYSRKDFMEWVPEWVRDDVGQERMKALQNGLFQLRTLRPKLSDLLSLVNMQLQGAVEENPQAFDLSARFKITEQSLERLQSEDVPEDVLKNLQGIKHKKFTTEREFLDAIGKARSAQHKSLILKHAYLCRNLGEDMKSRLNLAHVQEIRKCHEKIAGQLAAQEALLATMNLQLASLVLPQAMAPPPPVWVLSLGKRIEALINLINTYESHGSHRQPLMIFHVFFPPESSELVKEGDEWQRLRDIFTALGDMTCRDDKDEIQKVEIEVAGYASSAPFFNKHQENNMKLANDRALAVQGYFSALREDLLKKIHEDLAEKIDLTMNLWESYRNMRSYRDQQFQDYDPGTPAQYLINRRASIRVMRIPKMNSLPESAEKCL